MGRSLPCAGRASRRIEWCYGGTFVDVPRAGLPMRHLLIGVGLCVLVGCPGKAPPDQNNADGSVDGDGSVTPTTLLVSGKVVSYFTGEALDTTAITTDGLVPAVATTSAADGAYTIDVAVGSKLFAITSRTGART